MADPQRPGAGPVPAGPPGYVIRPPQPATPATPAAPSGPAATPSAAPATPAPAPAAPGVLVREPVLVGSLTQNGAVIGTGIMLGLAVVFFLIRGALRSHLIANRASLAQANGASWALFAFLLATAFTAVFGLLGGFWAALSFTVPMGALCLITLALFVALFNGARQVRR